MQHIIIYFLRSKINHEGTLESILNTFCSIVLLEKNLLCKHIYMRIMSKNCKLLTRLDGVILGVCIMYMYLA